MIRRWIGNPCMLALAVAVLAVTGDARARAEVPLVREVRIGLRPAVACRTSEPLPGLVADRVLGLLRHERLQGQVVHQAPQDVRGLFETRAVRTPKGDLLLLFPVGNHYAAGSGKVNDLVSYRSTDNGKTWNGPQVAFTIDYSQHGFIPLIPRGTNRIYAFGTQPIPSAYSRERGRHENTPIGFRYSDDDGYSWTPVQLIRPQNDPGFLGMSVTRMCETESGAWLLGTHAADWSRQPLETRQYLLRSTDKGASWTLLPGKRPMGWQAPELKRMDEGRPIHLGQDEVLFLARTPTGKIWESRSRDGGATWESPRPSPLVHPDAPPMVFHLSDRQTLLCLFHNRHLATQYDGLHGQMDGMRDRGEIWVCLSRDGGRRWSEPRFLFANATRPNPAKNGWFNHNVSYLDAVIDDGLIHIFCPHLWNRALHLTIEEQSLAELPTVADLRAAVARVSGE